MEDREHPLQWTDVFSALGSEHRLHIVRLLSREPVRCHEIQERLQLSQPAISYHLSKLESAGVLVKEKQGTRNCYRVRKEIADLVRRVFEEGEGTWNTQ